MSATNLITYRSAGRLVDDLKSCLVRARRPKAVLAPRAGLGDTLVPECTYELTNPSIRIDARGSEEEFQSVAITNAKGVNLVVEKFREKYGAKDVKKYYSTFDVAVVVALFLMNAKCH